MDAFLDRLIHHSDVALVSEESPRLAYADILTRGVYTARIGRVRPAIPHFLPQLPADAPRNRLGLADWIVGPANPLTARVTVNRMWQEVFGTGIVETTDDFGVMGAHPSHPELLDWLAVDFRDHGWDVKRFYKQLVMSATYRQSARATPALLEIDPKNRLLARGPRFRMDAEMLRDTVLAASGLLVEKIGGPSVKPYQPVGVWENGGYPGSNTTIYRQDHGEALHRRSLYTFWKRMATMPNMDAFDDPGHDASCTRRQRTNTPLQALVTMNDPQWLEAARCLAEQVMERDPTAGQRLDDIGRRLLAPPVAAAGEGNPLRRAGEVQRGLLPRYRRGPRPHRGGRVRPQSRLARRRSRRLDARRQHRLQPRRHPEQVNMPSCSDHHGEGPTVYDLPGVPPALREEWRRLETRRHFLGRMGKTLGWAGLATLMGNKLLAGAGAAPGGLPSPEMLRVPNFIPKAKRCIYLFMAGGPPQMDLWDYKPGLPALYDRDLPDSVRGSQVLTGMTAGQARFPIAPPAWGFTRHGQCGRWVSNLLPQTGKVVDELAVVRSIYTDAVNHEPAILLMNTGNMVPGKPSMGAWLSYGLGSMNDNLPAFVVLNSKLTVGNKQPISPRLWGSGFLSSEYAGVPFRVQGDPVLYLNDPKGMSHQTRRELIDSVNAINKLTYDELGDPETHARISEYEMAFRMQTSVPDLANMSDEPASTWDLYGADAKEPGTFAYNCLLARRMAERGVRFTQIFQRGWDVHTNAVDDLTVHCAETDRAS